MFYSTAATATNHLFAQYICVNAQPILHKFKKKVSQYGLEEREQRTHTF